MSMIGPIRKRYAELMDERYSKPLCERIGMHDHPEWFKSPCPECGKEICAHGGTGIRPL